MAELVCLKSSINAPDNVGKSIELGQATMFIGRFPDVHEGQGLSLNSSQVSKNHASVIWENGDYVIHDNGSTSGTYVNEKRVGSGVGSILQQGDIVKFGEFEFMVNLFSNHLERPKTTSEKALPTPLRHRSHHYKKEFALGNLSIVTAHKQKLPPAKAARRALEETGLYSQYDPAKWIAGISLIVILGGGIWFTTNHRDILAEIDSLTKEKEAMVVKCKSLEAQLYNLHQRAESEAQRLREAESQLESKLEQTKKSAATVTAKEEAKSKNLSDVQKELKETQNAFARFKDEVRKRELAEDAKRNPNSPAAIGKLAESARLSVMPMTIYAIKPLVLKTGSSAINIQPQTALTVLDYKPATDTVQVRWEQVTGEVLSESTTFVSALVARLDELGRADKEAELKRRVADEKAAAASALLEEERKKLEKNLTSVQVIIHSIRRDALFSKRQKKPPGSLNMVIVGLPENISDQLLPNEEWSGDVYRMGVMDANGEKWRMYTIDMNAYLAWMKEHPQTQDY